MGHRHAHSQESQPAFVVGIVLNLAFVAIEAIAGFAVDSLALMADAGHNLSDVGGLALAWGASKLVKRPPSVRYTYGWRRSSILAALANALLILIAVGAIAWEAVHRLWTPVPASGMTVIWVAAAGVVVNTITALLFMRGEQHDLNVRGAFLHMAADAIVSLGVIVAGFLIMFTGWLWIDPAISLMIGVVIIVGTWDLLRKSLDLALDAVPHEIDPARVRSYLTQLPGVEAVHDLHIWALSTTETALTAHLVRPSTTLDDEWLASVEHELHEQFAIDHTTLQIENGRRPQPCRQQPEDVV